MSWASTAPAALAGLTSAFKASPDLSGVPVRDGPLVTGSSALDVVLVGWNGQEGDDTAVDGSSQLEGLAGDDAESYEIRCAVLSTKGGGKPDVALAAARARAYELLAACGQAIKRDRTLGGAVMQAAISGHSLRQTPAPKGITAAIQFTVACSAIAR